MSFIKNIFNPKRKATVEFFGKLSFYRDFITVATSKEAVNWKAWLLDFTGKEYLPLPEGSWPFIFRSSSKSDVLVGLIEDSSDGIREFPFSIFCSISKSKSVFNQGTLDNIWVKLIELRNSIETVSNIDDLYKMLRGKVITYENGKNKLVGSQACEKLIIADKNNKWPQLSVFIEKNMEFDCIIHDSSSLPDEFLRKWKEASNNSIIAGNSSA